MCIYIRYTPSLQSNLTQPHPPPTSTPKEYNAKKRAEHTFKSLTADSSKISAVDPDFYAERFLNWMESHVA